MNDDDRQCGGPRSGPGGRIHALRRALRQFHGAESGATLTEFIVVLPVFIIIFAAIMRFTTLQSTVVQLQMASTKAVWEQAMPVQKNPNPAQRFTDPGEASDSSETNIDDANVNRIFSDQIDRRMAQRMEGGSIDEAAAAVSDSGAETYANLDLPPTTSNVTGNIRQVMRRTGGNYRHSPQLYGRRLVDDGSSRTTVSPPNARSPLDSMNLTPGKASDETNAAYAAGVRYGLVQDDRTAPAAAVDGIPGVSPSDLHVGYNTLVAPYPMVQNGNNQHYRPVGVARRYMRDHRPYRELIGIDFGR